MSQSFARFNAVALDDAGPASPSVLLSSACGSASNMWALAFSSAARAPVTSIDLLQDLFLVQMVPCRQPFQD